MCTHEVSPPTLQGLPLDVGVVVPRVRHEGVASPQTALTTSSKKSRVGTAVFHVVEGQLCQFHTAEAFPGLLLHFPRGATADEARDGCACASVHVLHSQADAQPSLQLRTPVPAACRVQSANDCEYPIKQSFTIFALPVAIHESGTKPHQLHRRQVYEHGPHSVLYSAHSVASPCPHQASRKRWNTDEFNPRGRACRVNIEVLP
mmetsp:Transcript_25210/g.81472  ORF Transcript_25210/g.81472 Transcript_25210/m.81472 type:complete len:204 (+) Transcript_25210:791-1402(+)